MKRANIELHIEELVLHGFDPRDRHQIGAAVEHELQRLFAEHGAPPSLVRTGAAIEHLDAGVFDARQTTKTGTVGVELAQALYGGLSR